MPGTAVAERKPDTRRKTIGKTVYVIRSVYSGKESINDKISNLIIRKAENSK